MISSRNADELAAAVAQLRERSPRVQGMRADVSNEADVDALFTEAQRQLGAVDVLVACAGIQGPIGPVEDTDAEEFRRTLDINLTGTWLCMRAAIRSMKALGHGKIITFSGGGATGPRERFSAYAASKAAAVRLTETAAEELRPFGIDVNSIAPGAVNTRMLEEVLAAGQRAGEELHGAVKRGREGGTPPERAAELVLFLASRASDGITGKLLSAVWDPWREQEFCDRLRADRDLATLRRIDAINFGALK